MSVYYTETERGVLDRMVDFARAGVEAVGVYQVRQESSNVSVWAGGHLQASIATSPCPDVALLNAYRWATQAGYGASMNDFHAWQPQHIKQIAEGC